MLFGQDRGELRRMYVDAWSKARHGEPLSPLEAQIAAVVEDHPEYQALLAADAVDRDYTGAGGQANPFLHMGLHLALRDQVKTDRPAGIRRLHARLAARSADAHDTEHRLMECLAETLWEAQTRKETPDEQHYLERVRSLLG